MQDAGADFEVQREERGGGELVVGGEDAVEGSVRGRRLLVAAVDGFKAGEGK